MPGLNHTGPMGQGAQTGRKQGSCRKENTASDETTTRGKRMRCGLGNRKNQEMEPPLGSKQRRGKGRGQGQKGAFGIGMERGRNQ